MTTIAVYSSKGGVGKTSLAVNLAWASATLSNRRTLLWDLDAQAAASFILAPDRAARDEARAVIERDVAPGRLIVPTAIPRLDLLPADSSLRTLDLVFNELGAKKRVLKISEALTKQYDRVIIDCPPGLGVTAQQIIRGASLIVLPLIPSALASRAAEEVRHYLDQQRKAVPPVLPVFTFVDRRRAGHLAALAAAPDQPAIQMASAVEQMAARHAPVGVYAPRSPVARSIADLWATIERAISNS